MEAAGGELASIAILDLPPDLEALREAAGGRFNRRVAPVPADEFGAAIGRQLVGGGPLVERVTEQLFTRFTGSLEGVGRMILVSQPPDELQADLSGEGRAFETSLIRAMDDASAGTVGVELTETDPSTVPVFSTAGISTVDNVEQVSGQVSLVFALLGADGDFGVKESATSLLPDPLPSPAQPIP